jgi:hypothetical protein
LLTPSISNLRFTFVTSIQASPLPFAISPFLSWPLGPLLHCGHSVLYLVSSSPFLS